MIPAAPASSKANPIHSAIQSGKHGRHAGEAGETVETRRGAEADSPRHLACPGRSSCEGAEIRADDGAEQRAVDEPVGGSMAPD